MPKYAETCHASTQQGPYSTSHHHATPQGSQTHSPLDQEDPPSRLRGVPPEPVIVVLGPFEGSGSPGWDRRVLWVLLAVMNL